MNKTVDKGSRIAKIKELLGYYKEITETVREPFIILDQALEVVTANAAFYRKFKVKKKDTVGRRTMNSEITNGMRLNYVHC